MMVSEKVARRRRTGLLLFAILGTFLYAGAFFGWGPMQLLMEANGSFSSKCTPEEVATNIICPEQTSALVNVQFFALVSQVTSPFLGMIVDRYGPKVLSYMMALCAWVGLMLLILGAAFVDWLLYPAFLLFAQSVWMGGLLTVQTGMCFTAGQSRSRVIQGLNSLFDAGSITYLGLWAIGEGTDASLTAIAGGYFGLSVVIFGGICYFWTITQPASEIAIESSPGKLIPNEESEGIEQRSDSADFVQDLEHETIANTDILCDAHNATNVADTKIDMDSKPPFIAKVHDDGYQIVATRQPRQQLTSGGFLLVALFFTIHLTSNQWIMTTTRNFLASLGDDEVNNKYLTIFTVLMPASLAALPFTDRVLVVFGFHGGFQAINILAVGYLLIRLLSDNLNVQIFGFLLFSFFRCFLFGITFSFLPTLLAANMLGKAAGILYAIGGVAIFINIPLSKFAIETKNGDFFIPDLMYTLLVIPCIVAAWGIGRIIHIEKMMTHVNTEGTEVDSSM